MSREYYYATGTAVYGLEIPPLFIDRRLKSFSVGAGEHRGNRLLRGAEQLIESHPATNIYYHPGYDDSNGAIKTQIILFIACSCNPQRR